MFAKLMNNQINNLPNGIMLIVIVLSMICRYNTYFNLTVTLFIILMYQT